MRILDRYLLREFLAFSFLGLGTFVALFIVVDLFEKLDIFVDHHTPILTVLRFYAHGLPTTLTEVLPLSLLLGSLLGLSQMRKYNEVTAMQSSGQSPLRLARPLLLTAFIASIAQYGMNESIGPGAYVEQQRILNEEIKQQSDADRQSRSEVRLLGLGNRFFIAQFFDARAATLRAVSVQITAGPTLRSRIDAMDARYTDGCWRFEHGYYRTFQDTIATAVPFNYFGSSRIEEQPPDFARTDQDPFHMGMKSLLAFARRLKESGAETRKHMTNFHLRASFPMANLVMVLLGTALSLRVMRGSNVALGFGLSVSIGFGYFACIRVGQALGYNGTLPPMLAAWMGNLVFSVIGGLLFWKVTR